MKLIRFISLVGIICLIASFSRPAMADSTIRIYIYNLAEVPATNLNRAISEAQRVLSLAGVKSEWQVQGQSTEDTIFDPDRTPTDLFVRILPESISSKFTKRSTVLGFAQPVGKNRFRYVASIFYNRVQVAAADVGVNLGVLLGHVVAHELGHLLLGPQSHAPRGVMRCPWDTNELNAAGQGRLRFSLVEMQRMRDQIAQRVVAATAAE